jgi:hypothetical protein
LRFIAGPPIGHFIGKSHIAHGVHYGGKVKGYTFAGSPYTNEQRIDAVVNYMILGTLSKTSEACGIPLTTLYDWKKTEWWEPLAVEARNEKEDEHHAAFSRIIDKATKRVEDALEHGETKMLKTKDGYEKHLVPVGAKDALMIAAISYDKKRLSENLPTSITSSDNKGIEAKLIELSNKLERREVSVVSEQKKGKT